MSGWRFIVVLVIIMCWAGFAACADAPVIIELTGAYTSASLSDSSAWGWWNPSKYDSWQSMGDDEIGIAAARIVWDHKIYPIMLGGEWYPKLEALGTVDSSEAGAGYSDQLVGDLEAYDLALGQKYGEDYKANITPWFGATHIRINESRDRVGEGGDASDPEHSSAQSRLWGVMIGADGEVPVSPGWVAIGTVVVRWARGDRDATLASESPVPTEVSQSDDTSMTMWGAEVGVQWDPTKKVHVAAGWRYRDWTYSDGPATFSGPFVRFGVSF